MRPRRIPTAPRVTTLEGLLAALVALPPRRVLTDGEAAALTAGRAKWQRLESNAEELPAPTFAALSENIEQCAVAVMARALDVIRLLRDPFAPGAAKALVDASGDVFSDAPHGGADTDHACIALATAVEHAPTVSQERPSTSLPVGHEQAMKHVYAPVRS